MQTERRKDRRLDRPPRRSGCGACGAVTCGRGHGRLGERELAIERALAPGAVAPAGEEATDVRL
jgi:hypothetical protein